MKKTILLLLVPIISSCFSLEKKTTKLEMEIYAISPSEGVSRYYLRGTKKSGVKRQIIIVDDNYKYYLGHKFFLSPE